MKANLFSHSLAALHRVTPFAAKITEEDAGFVFLCLPKEVSKGITDEQWTWACAQFMADPNKPKDLELWKAVCRYLFRLENDLPNFSWGLKADLDQRMLQSGFVPQTQSEYQLGDSNQDGPRHSPNGVLADMKLFDAK
jgi:hypothetical protein